MTWYGVWLFADWMDLAATEEVSGVAAVELQASRRTLIASSAGSST